MGLSAEKEEGEKVYDFEKRIVGAGRKVLGGLVRD